MDLDQFRAKQEGKARPSKRQKPPRHKAGERKIFVARLIASRKGPKANYTYARLTRLLRLAAENAGMEVHVTDHRRPPTSSVVVWRRSRG